ncbi:MAG: class I SAM-dependent methyltransferase family protein [Candidatus Omnitrophota bacterium]|nr:class I SAM-dependent methyltransferase family protein [Candidatus Omnitrophota bacterium]
MKRAIENLFYKKIVRNILLMSKLGRQSVLGQASSGFNFDHMYDNKPQGYYGIGRLIDAILLRLPAVEATRLRKRRLVAMLNKECATLNANGRMARIVDVACGAGRYLVETCEAVNQRAQIVGVDCDRLSLKIGKEIAARANIEPATLRFVRGNVFKLRHLERLSQSIAWAPNIVLASGLIVYLADEKVRKTFLSIRHTLGQGGLFVFSSQQSNPSRKLMEKVCTTQDGAWTLFYRQPDVLVTWLKDVGFDSVEFETDEWGMYNIFSARIR